MSHRHPPLRLRRGEERRLRAGHLWIYSNEVDVGRTPLAALEPGALVNVLDHRGKVLGTAYVNPHSLICARLLARRPDVELDAAFITARLERALSWRERLFDVPFYRLAYGESDGLPGLVVDRYGADLVVQITTAGMERVRAAVVEALQGLLRPRHLVLRNDTPARELEGLPAYVEAAGGSLPEVLEVEENGARFEVPAVGGHKTGWYYDHRLNRARLQQHARGRTVLDVFSYDGAWAVQALAAGAEAALCVDSSAGALARARDNAARNGVGERLEVMRGDAAEVLAALHEQGRKFDLVVLDPPAFVKRRRDLKAGAAAYRRINGLALRLLPANGLLVSCSCSYHMPRERLLSEIRQAALHGGRLLQVVEQGHQGPDHPVHPAMPETDYLKAFFCRVI